MIDTFQLVSILLLPGVFLAMGIAFVATIFYLANPTIRNKQAIGIFSMASVLGFVAFVVGFISANARETVVGDVVPVLVAGFGALLVYTYVKNQVQVFAAGVAAVAFSTALFAGMVFGGQHRENLSGTELAVTNFSDIAQGPDQTSLHRSDLAAYNAALNFLEIVSSGAEESGQDYSAVIELVGKYVLPRRNYHMKRAFTDVAMDRYLVLLDNDPTLDLSTIEDDFNGSEKILFREIHFTLNPLEGFLQ